MGINKMDCDCTSNVDLEIQYSTVCVFIAQKVHRAECIVGAVNKRPAKKLLLQRTLN